MGQAKRRGTPEQRRAAAAERQAALWREDQARRLAEDQERRERWARRMRDRVEYRDGTAGRIASGRFGLAAVATLAAMAALPRGAWDAAYVPPHVGE